MRHRATWRWRPDLYCIELLPAPGVNLAAGVARLRPPSSPFGLAVTPAGAVLCDVDLELPEAPDLTPFPGATTLVAWAATPQFDSEMRLGEVRPGVTRVGRIPFDRFLVLVSAEPSARVTERNGRVLLRGTSAAVRMQPHDMAFVLAGLSRRPRRRLRHPQVLQPPRLRITTHTRATRCRPSRMPGSRRRCIPAS